MSIDIQIVLPPKKNMSAKELRAWFDKELEQHDEWLDSVEMASPAFQKFYQMMITKCPPMNDPKIPLSDEDCEKPNVVDYSFSTNFCQIGIRSDFPDGLMDHIGSSVEKNGLQVMPYPEPDSNTVPRKGSWFKKITSIFTPKQKSAGSTKAPAVQNQKLATDLSKLVSDACKLKSRPKVTITQVDGDKILVELTVQKADFGTVAKAAPNFTKKLRSKASAVTGKSTVVIEVVEE